MTIEELKKMPLHSEKWVDEFGLGFVKVSVLRVVGGWIYCFQTDEHHQEHGVSAVFVPESELK